MYITPQYLLTLQPCVYLTPRSQLSPATGYACILRVYISTIYYYACIYPKYYIHNIISTILYYACIYPQYLLSLQAYVYLPHGVSYLLQPAKRVYNPTISANPAAMRVFNPTESRLDIIIATYICTRPGASDSFALQRPSIIRGAI